jgi:hypothetical protein
MIKRAISRVQSLSVSRDATVLEMMVLCRAKSDIVCFVPMMLLVDRRASSLVPSSRTGQFERAL